MLTMNEKNVAKAAAGQAAADLIQSGMIVGLGTGSTAHYFIQSLSRRCKEGLKIYAVATSQASEKEAAAGGIPLLKLDQLMTLDLTVDGADEVDVQKQLIKGGGGALMREKIIASLSREMVVIIDEDKLVDQLGKFSLPLEIIPFAHEAILFRLKSLGYRGNFRQNEKGVFFRSENGNYIADLKFPSQTIDPFKEEKMLRSLPGVLETGFFLNMAGRLIVGKSDGSFEMR